MCDNSEERARWRVPRPGYMREIEPGNSMWPSVDPVMRVDPAEQAYNRQLFKKGMNRYVRPGEAEAKEVPNEDSPPRQKPVAAASEKEKDGDREQERKAG